MKPDMLAEVWARPIGLQDLRHAVEQAQADAVQTVVGSSAARGPAISSQGECGEGEPDRQQVERPASG